MKLKYVVTGTGRSGTVFMARFLTSVGIPCGHETIFDYRGIHGARRRLGGDEKLKLSVASTVRHDVITNRDFADHWDVDLEHLAAESSYMAAPFLNDPLLVDAKVIHAVRHPARVINSFCNHIFYFQKDEPSNVYENLIYAQLPELKAPMPQYDRAALYYILWNQLIEKRRADLFFRVEDESNELLAFLGLPVGTPHFNDPTINTYRRTNTDRFHCGRLESQQIKSDLVAIGERYRYDMSSDYLLI